MAKIVINTRYGGFKLSDQALEMLQWTKGPDFDEFEIARDDPLLVKVVEALGPAASGSSGCALDIVEVPAGTRWHIHEYDGAETVRTPAFYEGLDWKVAED